MKQKKIYNERTGTALNPKVVVDTGKEKLESVDYSVVGGAGEVITGTHAEILALQVAGTLTVGAKYVITDFETKYQQPVTNTIKTSATTETLVLTATSSTTFDIFVQSVEYSKDILKYEIDDILCEDGTTARNGKITYREDEVGKITHYDFRTVLFPRWETSTGSGVFTVLSDNGEAMQEFLTFGNDCYDINIGQGNGSFIYNNIVYGTDCHSMTYGDECRSMTYGDECRSMTYGSGCRTMTYGTDCYSMTYGDSCYSMTYGDSCHSKTCGSRCRNLTASVTWQRVDVKSNINFDTIDFSSATHVAGAYDCEIYTDSVLGTRLRYVASNVDTFANVNA